MKLIKFRITNYKTIEDTGWLNIDNITSLVGVNEAGKSNIITALLKLNPVDDELKINILNDYPRGKFAQDVKNIPNLFFAEAIYELEKTFVKKIIKEETDEEGNISEKEIVEGEFNYIKLKKSYDNKLSMYLLKNLEDKNESFLITEDKINENLPKFIYYASYANLDTEIHLPTVINNVNNYKNLPEKPKNKAKTLKLLFDYIGLSPNDILSLGSEQSHGTSNKAEETILAEQEKKKERLALLNSASKSMSDEFKEWWKQGDYTFRFHADGDYFTVYVKDSLRTEEIELEHRSSGLQWFFSFYLIFQAESRNSHQDTIILLDEPGHTLHPMSQKDLAVFFSELSAKNQLIYTTHSPFLIDSTNITQAKAVFVDSKGLTKVTDDLKANKKQAEKSIYPINSAIGITISDTMLIGCKPIIVEGVSDQIYLSYIKRYLMKHKGFSNTEELIFLPVDGTKNIKPIVSIITGRDDELPCVLIDNDVSGKEKSKNLQKGLYIDDKDKVLNVNDFLLKTVVDAEIEDIMVKDILIEAFNKEFKFDEDFEIDETNSLSIVKQIENFCKNNEYELSIGWKVLLSRRYIQSNSTPSDEIIGKWELLFEKFKG